MIKISNKEVINALKTEFKGALQAKANNICVNNATKHEEITIVGLKISLLKYETPNKKNNKEKIIKTRTFTFLN